MKILSRLKSFGKETVFPYLILAVAMYCLFMIGKAIFRNYLAAKNLETVRADVQELAEENEALRNKIAYLKTDIYKEREARAKLDLIKKGEKLVIIVDPKTDEDPALKKKKKKVDATKSIPEQWIEYFFPE